MTHIDFVMGFLTRQAPGEPIYTADISQAFAVEFGIDIKKAKAAVSVAMKRVLASGQVKNLRCYQKGIYYLTAETPFGELGVNKEAIIQKKYLLPDIGYEAGYTVLYHMGLTTQIPAERVLVTNMAKDCIRENKTLNVYVRPPKVTVNQDNKKYLQILDAVELMDKAPIDIERPFEVLTQYLTDHNINYQKLLAYADRYYGKTVILQIARIAAAGGVTI